MPNDNVSNPEEPNTSLNNDSGSRTFVEGHDEHDSKQITPQSPSQHSFFSHAIKPQRKQFLIAMAAVTVVTIFAMWAFPPIYWASLAYSTTHAHKLKVWVVDYDGAIVGQGVKAAVGQVIDAGASTSLGWEIITDNSDPKVSDSTAVQSGVVEEKVWAAVVINANATSNLFDALHSTSPSSYNPTSAITVYYNQGRNEQAAGNFIVPQTTALLQKASARLSANITSQFVQNATDINTLKTASTNAPAAFGEGVAFSFVNLRPFSAPVATAIILVGQIYSIIFTFIITMAGASIRPMIAPYLTLKWYIIARIVVPCTLYFPLSLSYATISLPFKPPFGAKYTYAGGFFLYWIFVYLMMLAMGLATEAMITLMTPRFIAYFLLGLIIANVSVATLPNDLQEGFFRYGKGFPVYNASQAIRTILFNTKNHLGLNAGVIICWIILSMFTTALFTFLTERKARKEATYPAQGSV